MKTLALIVALCATSLVVGGAPIASGPLLPPASIGTKLYVADFTEDTVFVLEDLNTDGDCNDAGEIVSFFDTTSPDPNLHLATPRSLVMGPDGALYVGDANQDFILRLEDLDGDGTANQAGEATIFYDANSGAPGLVSVSNLAFDQEGFLYFTDTGTSGATDRVIAKIRDENRDGYCVTADGEVAIVYSRDTTTGTSIERTAGLIILPDGSLLGSDFDLDRLHLFRDTPGAEDGDANDVDEQPVVFDTAAGTTELNFAEHLALGLEESPGVRSIFINAGPTEDTIWRFRDDDLDGEFANPTETTVFWDTTQADGLVPANARTLVVDPTGSVWALEAGSGSVEEAIMILTDLNGDGDVNDAGEARVFADNSNLSGVEFGQPQGMALELDLVVPQLLFIRSDCNVDGGTDIGDAVFTLEILFSTPTVLDCEKGCDSNDDGNLDISDAIFTLS
ncbi:MAG: hypothetical protein AAF517_28765, partial [Planctomycetota bacterium]